MELKGFHFDFVGRMRAFVIISILLTIGSLVIVQVKGLNYGIDFHGGVRLQYRFSHEVNEAEVRKSVDSLGLSGFSVQKIGKPEEYRLLVNIGQDTNTEFAGKKITEALQKDIDPQASLDQEISVGPKAGSELRKKAILAVIVSWLLILIYIGFRFDFYFAPGAIIALIHDVLIALGAFALTGREISLTVIAAFLTIVGYSINDTIVIYDRIRENIPEMTKLSLRELINLSINETFSRTIITSLTVFIVVVILFLFGEGDIQNFGFAMMFGTISGAYSTVFVATPCYIFLKESKLFNKAK